MKQLTNKEMESVNGGIFLALFVMNTVKSLDISGAINKIFSEDGPVTPPVPEDKAAADASSRFIENMQKMFGSSGGRDLAKVAEKIGLVGVVNSIFGW
ncbi:bacteriocin [Entomohabitans teleogrylli]|uniref:bacteriocin n=1 Tax=Entomohabitans teleogrylli TaxID=1384589 RepID=UPI00073D1D59|nr:bacteriocin [Entomohabitans teleogrylli]